MFKRGNKSSNSWRNSLEIPAVILVIFFISTFVFLFLQSRPNSEKSSSSIGILNNNLNIHISSIKVKPTVEFKNKTELIWKIPDSPKAVLFIAHGCNGKALNFWDKSPSCPKCVGLPEERLIVLQALARNFAVLTVTSARRCWTFGNEIFDVKGIIKWWTGKEKLKTLPLVALGASSGGYFVSALANELGFSSIAIMIAEGIFDRMDVKENYPPTLFIHMPKDQNRKQRISQNMKLLREKGVDVKEVKCMEFALSPSFLSDRVLGLDRATSVKLFDLFKEKGVVDDDGYMKNDGRATRWKVAIREENMVLPLKNIVDHIQEEMNLAYAYHEMTSLQCEDMFRWFESHMS